jgi:adenylate cyclase
MPYGQWWPAEPRPRLGAVNYDASQQDCLAACAMTDAEGYTGVAEEMDPPELVGLVNRYFRALFRAVLGNGGLVLDVKGDGILALWTSEAPDAALRARVCRSCLQMVEASDRFNMCFPARRLPTRIGVDFGPVALANVGAFERYEYRAVGDTVNTCARLEQLNKQLGTRVLVSQQLAEGIDGFLFRDLGEFMLRGKRAPLRVLELVAAKAAATRRQRALCEAFALALAAYERGSLGPALEAFGSLRERYPDDGPTRLFLRRCTEAEGKPGFLPGAMRESHLAGALH